MIEVNLCNKWFKLSRQGFWLARDAGLKLRLRRPRHEDRYVNSDRQPVVLIHEHKAAS